MRSREERNRMVEENMGLAYKGVELYGGLYLNTKASYISRDDLLQTACISLIKAAEKFDEGRGYSFSNYALTSIRREFYLNFHSLIAPGDVQALMSDFSIEDIEKFQDASDEGTDLCYEDEDFSIADLKVSLDTIKEKMKERNNASMLMKGLDIIMLRFMGYTIRESCASMDMTFEEGKSAYQITKVFLAREKKYLLEGI